MPVQKEYEALRDGMQQAAAEAAAERAAAANIATELQMARAEKKRLLAIQRDVVQTLTASIAASGGAEAAMPVRSGAAAPGAPALPVTGSAVAAAANLAGIKGKASNGVASPARPAAAAAAGAAAATTGVSGLKRKAPHDASQAGNAAKKARRNAESDDGDDHDDEDDDVADLADRGAAVPSGGERLHYSDTAASAPSVGLRLNASTHIMPAGAAPGAVAADAAADDDSHCSVCHHAAPEGTPPLVLCDGGCGTEVHAACYGMSEVPDGDWYCDRCDKHVAHGKRLRCALCRRRDDSYGMMYVGKKWQHVVCRRYVLGDRYTTEGTCCFCDLGEGRKLRCNVSTCGKYAHASCAQAKKGYLDSEPLRHDPGTVVGYLYCDVHAKAKAFVAANGVACGIAGLHTMPDMPPFTTKLASNISDLAAAATNANPRGVDPGATYTDAEKRRLAKPGAKIQRWFMMPDAAFEEIDAAINGDNGSAAAVAGAAGGAATSSSGGGGGAGRWIDGVVGITNQSTGWTTVTYEALGGVEECLPLMDASPLWVKLAPAAVAAGGAGASSSSSSGAGASSGKYPGSR